MPRRSILLGLALAPLLAASAGAACRTLDGAPRFEIEQGVTFDRASGLEWRRCALGASSRRGGASASRSTPGSTGPRRRRHGSGEGWRLPDVKELWELLDEGCGEPPIDRAVFPDLEGGPEGEGAAWTTTPMGMADLVFRRPRSRPRRRAQPVPFAHGTRRAAARGAVSGGTVRRSASSFEAKTPSLGNQPRQWSIRRSTKRPHFSSSDFSMNSSGIWA
ncbi:DUF1566 domain-containing protein [Pinisolibacter aquiterrae]|uniref:Lcl domain-containing protein n=1 Tax=Pinisolibacter aquiterrae TaxID=2815579 RepID=UPI001C3CA0B9|nr:DUF1566 domain-containing protein [Pinisolibacter aquiterrae]